jgi:hypothetical protein
MALTSRDVSELPLWSRAITVVLIPFVLPATLLVVLLLLLAMAWSSVAYGVHWLRWRVFGVPIQPTCPPLPGPAG